MLDALLAFFWFLVFEIRGIEVGLHTVHIFIVSQTGRLWSTAEYELLVVVLRYILY